MHGYDKYEPKDDWERSVLAFNPFEGDFGDCADVTFKDRIVKGKKLYKCQHCLDLIQPGQKQRYIMQKFDGQIGAWRFCFQCCDAMTKIWNGDWETYEHRHSIVAVYIDEPPPGIPRVLV